MGHRLMNGVYGFFFLSKKFLLKYLYFFLIIHGFSSPIYTSWIFKSGRINDSNQQYEELESLLSSFDHIYKVILRFFFFSLIFLIHL